MPIAFYIFDFSCIKYIAISNVMMLIQEIKIPMERQLMTLDPVVDTVEQ